MGNDLEYGIKISLLSEDDGGGYFVEVPDLPGCMADGDTLEEALDNIKKAIETWIAAAKETGRPIPEPKYYTDEDHYSGKLLVRMPKELHKELARTAQEQGVSINQLIVYYLAKSVASNEISITLSSGDSIVIEALTQIQKRLWSEVSDSQLEDLLRKQVIAIGERRRL